MKIVVLGSHGTGKTTLTKKISNYLNQEVSKMKIGVTGSHGTGKTTLSQFLWGKIKKPKWRYLDDSPRQAQIKGFNINEQTSLASEIWIIGKQLEMELLTPPPWIADKCLIDLLAYGRYLFAQEKEFLRVFNGLVKEYSNYDIVFYLPSGEFPIEDDGVRSLDPKFQADIDKLILEILAETDIEHYKIVGNPEERFLKAKEIIDQKLRV